MSTEIFKRAPEKLRKLQIGQVYDATLDKIKEIYCLDLQALYEDEKVKFSNDEVVEFYSFKDYSGEKTDHSVFNIGGGVKGGGLAASVAAAYNYYNEKASMLKENSVNAEIYKVKKVSIWLINIENGSDNFIDYISDKSDLKSDYRDIQKTKNKTAKKILIEKFKLKWGTGLITKLQLMGGATAEISFTSNSTDTKSKTVHEAELSFESRFVSANGKLQLNNEIRQFDLSVNMKGTVISFPSEVKSYKDYVDAQVKYLKEYIEKKSTSATAPAFEDNGARKPITIKHLNLKESKKDTPEEKAVKTRKSIEKLEDILDDPDFDDIVLAVNTIETLDEQDLSKIKGLKKEYITRFDDCKKTFKEELINAIRELEPLAQGDRKLSDKAIQFLDKIRLKMTKIKNYKILDGKEGDTKKLFNEAEIDKIKKIIKTNLDKVQPQD